MASFLFLLGAVLILTLASSIHAQVNADDRRALLAFWNGLTDKGLLNWNTNNNLCGQSGVNCYADRVFIIDIQSYKLAGTLPTEFGLLSNMRDLFLSNNKLNGTIPSQIPAATQYLNLKDNRFTGTIPTEWSLHPFNFLYLAGNPLCYCINYGIWSASSDYGSTGNCQNCENPCQNNGRCLTGELGYTCSCPANVTGLQCENDHDRCRSSPCKNGGTCVNSLNGFSCQCPQSSTTGDLCETCKPGYFGEGCLPCGCGIGSNSSDCTNLGDCSCNQNFAAPKCTGCNVGYRLIDEECWGTVCTSHDTMSTKWPETFGGEAANGVCQPNYSVFNGIFPTPLLFPRRNCIVSADNRSASWEAENSTCEETCVSRECENAGTCYQGMCVCDSAQFTGRYCEEAAVLSCKDLICQNTGKCVSGMTSRDPATCDCTDTSYIGATCDILLVAIIALPITIAITMIVYFILCRLYPKAKNTVVLSFALTLYDFVTDCAFMFSQYHKNSAFFAASFTFLIVPLLFNLLTVARIFVVSVLHQPEVAKWLKGNFTTASAVAILSATNIEMFSILHSNLFYKDGFNAPFDAKALKLIMIAGMVGSFLEDIPQLIIQSIAASDHLDTITFLSIVASILTIFFGIFKRSLMFLVAKFGVPKQAVYSKQPDDALEGEEALSSVYTNFEESK